MFSSSLTQINSELHEKNAHLQEVFRGVDRPEAT